MRLRYFVADGDRLRRTPQAVVEDLWTARRKATELKFPPGDELLIFTVLCDNDLHPKICYFLRLELTDGTITEASRRCALRAVQEGNLRNLDHPSVLYQLSGWPSDWQQQLAVALDVPARELNKIGIGGPLPISSILGLSLKESLRHFERALNG